MAQSATASAPLLRIGTRGSPLALAQARQVRARLAAALACEPERVAIVPIRTSGDTIQDRPLAEAGGKGLFTKEIEEALIAGAIDVAVHSAKDMPTLLPAGLAIAACLPREDARDVFISRVAKTLAALKPGAVVGTASLRRQAQVLRLRPDVEVVAFRGNVETRIAKLEAGKVDATLLALAGLRRLGLEQAATAVLGVDEFVPAVGQGIIAMETRDDDATTRNIVEMIGDQPAQWALAAERGFLSALDGSCRSPIAGHAVVAGAEVRFRGMILRADGSEVLECQRVGAAAEAVALGRDAGMELRGRAPPGFLSA
ncbi:MAG: hydroxymethylbilane synthase [Rhizobiales bacterium]|nr:hydroxymethylbilane synthase [Hyphomicrobiales bacterium]